MKISEFARKPLSAGRGQLNLRKKVPKQFKEVCKSSGFFVTLMGSLTSFQFSVSWGSIAPK
jgi:hypothetical protein